jgi:hypothetical protein
MEQDEAANPLAVRLLCLVAVMMKAKRPRDLVHELRWHAAYPAVDLRPVCPDQD